MIFVESRLPSVKKVVQKTVEKIDGIKTISLQNQSVEISSAAVYNRQDLSKVIYCKNK